MKTPRLIIALLAVAVAVACTATAPTGSGPGSALPRMSGFVGSGHDSTATYQPGSTRR